MFKRVMIGLLGLGLIVMLGTEAKGLCVTGTGGSCQWIPNTLECFLSGKAQGPGDKALLCTGDGLCPAPGVTDASGDCIHPTTGLSITRFQATGILACVNNGTNFGVGTTTIPLPADLSGLTVLTPGNIDPKGDFTNVPVMVELDQAAKDRLTPSCPGGKTWTAFDVAFCGSLFESFGEVALLSSGQLTNPLQIVDQIRVVCNGSCSSISFNAKANPPAFTGPPYTCQYCPLKQGLWDCASCTLAGGTTNCKQVQ